MLEPGVSVKVRGYRGSVKLLSRLETPTGSGWRAMWVGHHLVAVRDQDIITPAPLKAPGLLVSFGATLFLLGGSMFLWRFG